MRQILTRVVFLSLFAILISGCNDCGSFEEGDVGTCSDGCNTCSCDGEEVSSTAIGCGGPPGPAAGKLHCQEGEQSYRHGARWTCASGLGECTCSDGDVLQSEARADAGSASG